MLIASMFGINLASNTSIALAATGASITNTQSTTTDQAAASTADAQNEHNLSVTSYQYREISGDDAQRYFIIAGLFAASGALIYLISYIPMARQASRSRYVSRYYDYAKTTY